MRAKLSSVLLLGGLTLAGVGAWPSVASAQELGTSWVPETGHTKPTCVDRNEYRVSFKVHATNHETETMHFFYEDAAQSGSKLPVDVAPGGTWTHEVFGSLRYAGGAAIQLYARFSKFTWTNSGEHVDGPITETTTVPGDFCVPEDQPTTTVQPGHVCAPGQTWTTNVEGGDRCMIDTTPAPPPPEEGVSPPPSADESVPPPDETTPTTQEATPVVDTSTVPPRRTTTVVSALPPTGGGPGPVLPIGVSAAVLGFGLVLWTRRRVADVG